MSEQVTKQELDIQVRHNGEWHTIQNDGRVHIKLSDENQSFVISESDNGWLNVHSSHHRPLIDPSGNNVMICGWRRGQTK